MPEDRFLKLPQDLCLSVECGTVDEAERSLAQLKEVIAEAGDGRR